MSSKLVSKKAVLGVCFCFSTGFQLCLKASYSWKHKKTISKAAYYASICLMVGCPLYRVAFGASRSALYRVSCLCF